MDLSTLTKKEIELEDPKRWYLGEGVSKIQNGDSSYLIIKIADFPEAKWNEWSKDCKDKFNNCRWAKMMDDHAKANMLSLVVDNKFKVEQKKEEPKAEICIGGQEIG